MINRGAKIKTAELGMGGQKMIRGAQKISMPENLQS